MKLRKISVEELRELYQRELCFDFPAEELKPLSSMERLMADGRYDPMVMEDQGESLGYALVWLDRDRRYALLDHLGVLRGKRNGGLGSELLTLLGEQYPELFGEAEAPDSGDPEEDQLRARRLGFYARNGFRQLSYECAMFGMHYRALYRGPEKDDDLILQKHRKVYQDFFSREQMQRFIQLPLKKGEPVKPAVRWQEEERT